jgi:dimethylaniline monooxygenase (N-oxide forming)
MHPPGPPPHPPANTLSAMDISYRAVRQEGSTVALSTRHGFLSVPAVMDNGKPLDIFISNLFEHSYEHPWVHDWQLKWKISTWVIRAGFFIATGSSWGWNQWACRVKEVFLCVI